MTSSISTPMDRLILATKKKCVIQSIMTLFNHDVAAGKTLDKISPDSIKMSSAKWSKYFFFPLLATA